MVLLGDGCALVRTVGFADCSPAAWPDGLADLVERNAAFEQFLDSGWDDRSCI
jgi:hypothetical protein